MILELDAGNSRIKWRIASDTGSEVHAHGVAVGLADLPGQLTGTLMQDVCRVRVSSVREREFAEEFTALAQNVWRLQAEFAVVTVAAAGVTNAYTDVGTMGVDRWLAMLAAFELSGTSCCVLDCGSAITFDMVDDTGRHRGGYIVPGLQLMRQSLAGKTRALDIPFGDWGEPAPGNSTATAIGNGILAMVSGFAEHCRHGTLADGSPGAKWFLTGGDAEIVSRLIPWEHQLVKDLVLDGLALALP